MNQINLSLSGLEEMLAMQYLKERKCQYCNKISVDADEDSCGLCYYARKNGFKSWVSQIEYKPL